MSISYSYYQPVPLFREDSAPEAKRTTGRKVTKKIWRVRPWAVYQDQPLVETKEMPPPHHSERQLRKVVKQARRPGKAVNQKIEIVSWTVVMVNSLCLFFH